MYELMPVSFAVMVIATLNYVVYALGGELFILGIYAGVVAILSVILWIIKCSDIEAFYKGPMDMQLVANIFAWVSGINTLVGLLITSQTRDPAYVFFSGTIMMSGTVFFSLFAGKTTTAFNLISFGYPRKEMKGRKGRGNRSHGQNPFSIKVIPDEPTLTCAACGMAFSVEAISGTYCPSCQGELARD